MDNEERWLLLSFSCIITCIFLYVTIVKKMYDTQAHTISRVNKLYKKYYLHKVLQYIYSLCTGLYIKGKLHLADQNLMCVSMYHQFISFSWKTENIKMKGEDSNI